MIIFRFSTAFLAVIVAACSDGRPHASTELSNIVSVDRNFSDVAAQLQRFAEARLKDRAALRREFANAGFVRSVFVDPSDEMKCERYDLTTNDFFPSVYFVNICGDKVFANAGQLAP